MHFNNGWFFFILYSLFFILFPKYLFYPQLRGRGLLRRHIQGRFLREYRMQDALS